MYNAVFAKTMENMIKHRDIKLVTTEKRRDCLVSEPNYHTTKCFTEHLLAMETKQTEILILLCTCLFRTFNSRIK